MQHRLARGEDDLLHGDAAGGGAEGFSIDLGELLDELGRAEAGEALDLHDAGVALDDALVKTIKTNIRKSCTPRHVPALVLAAPDIPRTISGKKVEIAVTRVLHNEPVANRDALKNPESLDWYASAKL